MTKHIYIDKHLIGAVVAGRPRGGDIRNSLENYPFDTSYKDRDILGREVNPKRWNYIKLYALDQDIAALVVSYTKDHVYPENVYVYAFVLRGKVEPDLLFACLDDLLCKTNITELDFKKEEVEGKPFQELTALSKRIA